MSVFPVRSGREATGCSLRGTLSRVRRPLPIHALDLTPGVAVRCRAEIAELDAERQRLVADAGAAGAGAVRAASVRGLVEVAGTFVAGAGGEHVEDPAVLGDDDQGVAAARGERDGGREVELEAGGCD